MGTTLTKDKIHSYLEVINDSPENQQFITRALGKLPNDVFSTMLEYLVRGQLDIANCIEHFNLVSGVTLSAATMKAFLADYESGNNYANRVAIMNLYETDQNSVRGSYVVTKLDLGVTTAEALAGFLGRYASYQSKIIRYSASPDLADRTKWVTSVLALASIKAQKTVVFSNANATSRFVKLAAFVEATLSASFLTETLSEASSFESSEFGQWLITGKYRINDIAYLQAAFQDFASLCALTASDQNLAITDAETLVSTSYIADWEAAWDNMKQQTVLTNLIELFPPFLAKYYFIYKFSGLSISTAAQTTLTSIKSEISSWLSWLDSINTLYSMIKTQLELKADVNSIIYR